MLKGLIPSDKVLSAEEEAKIGDLQAEIDAIWSRRGDYKIDDEAWRSMPLFMEKVTEDDVANNEGCAAMASILYDDVPAEEMANNRKTHGNEMLQRAMNPEQTNKDNMARAAVNCYTEGLMAAKNGSDCPPLLIAQLYGNRSAAHFLMMNFGHALQDGQRAILVDPSYNKAYFRAAKAAERVRKYDIALNLIEKGLTTIPPPSAQAAAEFETLKAEVNASIEAQAAAVKKERMKQRVDAADTSNILRAITSKGIKINPRPEVTSEQMAQLQKAKPYFGKSDDMLHVPLLFMYDEFSTTDFVQDISCDCCLADILDEMMPFPFDDKQRYATLDDIVAVYKVDDGVKMPEYYAFDPTWPLLEVFRMPTYQMPGLLPVIHIISRHSTQLIAEWKLKL